MTDHPANDQFHASSFMQGHNAEYLEQMYAGYANAPSAIDESGLEVFKAAGNDGNGLDAEPTAPLWARPDWPTMPAGDLANVLTGAWPAQANTAGGKIAEKATPKGVGITDTEIQRAVLVSNCALMISRARRICGHLADVRQVGRWKPTAAFIAGGNSDTHSTVNGTCEAGIVVANRPATPGQAVQQPLSEG